MGWQRGSGRTLGRMISAIGEAVSTGRSEFKDHDDYEHTSTTRIRNEKRLYELRIMLELTCVIRIDHERDVICLECPWFREGQNTGRYDKEE